MEKGSKSIHYAWWIMAIGFVLYFFVQAFTNQVPGLFTKPISAEFNVPRSVFLLHNVFMNLAGFLAAPLWGRLYKKYNFQRLLAFCIVMTAVGFFFRSISTNIYMVIASGFFRGVFFIGTTILPMGLLVASWFEKKRGFATSMITVAASLGGVVFNPLIQTLISSSGWRVADRLSGILVAAMAPLVLLFVRSDPEKKGLKPYGYTGAESAAVEVPKTGLTAAEARKTPSLYFLLFASFSSTFVAGAMMQLSPYLTDSGYDPLFAASAISILGVFSIIGRPLMGMLHDKAKPGTAAAIIFVSAAAGFLCLNFPLNKFLLGAAIVIWGFNSGISLIMPPLWTMEVFGAKDYAVIFSLVVAINRFGSLAGGYLIGLLHDLTGSNNLIWPICSAMMLISLAGMIYSFRASNKRKAQETV
ncbi:MAG: MFS transporter [Spirochaetaceae bacterium]|jgi:predicted MFS family arabinose efflux permease|nr:MFS transporter [Spirochaetaceae bacterium]